MRTTLRLGRNIQVRRVKVRLEPSRIRLGTAENICAKAVRRTWVPHPSRALCERMGLFIYPTTAGPWISFTSVALLYAT